MWIRKTRQSTSSIRTEDFLEEEFSKDGKTYIGKEGKELVNFNKYRQMLREELEKDKTKDFGKKQAVDVADPESSEKTLTGEEVFPKILCLNRYGSGRL